MKILVNINVDPSLLEEVCKSLVEMSEVMRAYEITGQYDVFLEMEVDSVEDFRRILKEKILGIDGVKLTESSVVLGVWKDQ